MLLYSLFNSVRDSLLALSGIPFAVAGGILGLYVAGLNASVSAAVGFISLFGVSAMDGILLVSYIRREHGRGHGHRDGHHPGGRNPHAANLHDRACRPASAWCPRRSRPASARRFSSRSPASSSAACCCRRSAACSSSRRLRACGCRTLPTAPAAGPVRCLRRGDCRPRSMRSVVRWHSRRGPTPWQFVDTFATHGHGSAARGVVM